MSLSQGVFRSVRVIGPSGGHGRLAAGTASLYITYKTGLRLEMYR